MTIEEIEHRFNFLLSLLCNDCKGFMKCYDPKGRGVNKKICVMMQNVEYLRQGILELFDEKNMLKKLVFPIKPQKVKGDIPIKDDDIFFDPDTNKIEREVIKGD